MTPEAHSRIHQKAMTFRTPILINDLDFARKVGGGAALYFNQWEIEILATSLDQLINNKDLRKKLEILGGARLKSLQAKGNTSKRRVTTLIDELLSNRTCDLK